MEKHTRNSVLHKVVSELPVTEGGHHRPLARERGEALSGTKARQDWVDGVGGVGHGLLARVFAS